MPSTPIVGLLLAAAVVAYSVVVVGRLLPGILLAALVYLAVWLADHLSVGSVTAAFGTGRLVLTATLALAVLAYSVLVATEVLLGVLVALVVVAVSWATIPDGPVARLLSTLTDSGP